MILDMRLSINYGLRISTNYGYSQSSQESNRLGFIIGALTICGEHQRKGYGVIDAILSSSFLLAVEVSRVMDDPRQLCNCLVLRGMPTTTWAVKN